MFSPQNSEAGQFIPVGVGIVENPIYKVKSFGIAALEKAKINADVALMTCYTGETVTCGTLIPAVKILSWATFFGLKVA